MISDAVDIVLVVILVVAIADGMDAAALEGLISVVE